MDLGSEIVENQKVQKILTYKEILNLNYIAMAQSIWQHLQKIFQQYIATKLTFPDILLYVLITFSYHDDNLNLLDDLWPRFQVKNSIIFHFLH